MAGRWMVLLVLLGLVLDNSLVLSRSRQARQVGEEEEEEELAGRPKLSHSCLTIEFKKNFIGVSIRVSTFSCYPWDHFSLLFSLIFLYTTKPTLLLNCPFISLSFPLYLSCPLIFLFYFHYYSSEINYIVYLHQFLLVQYMQMNFKISLHCLFISFLPVFPFPLLSLSFYTLIILPFLLSYSCLAQLSYYCLISVAYF